MVEFKDYAYSIGIILTFVIGLINYRNNKKTSYINSVTAERVKWINILRENVSKYTGLTYHWVVSEIDPDSKESKEIIRELDQLNMLIRLQINPKEDLGKKVIAHLDKIPDLTHKSYEAELKSKLHEMVKDVQELLKEEWDKVKDEAENGRLPQKT
ncbi:hypothetical protein [Vibrio kanaloae]|uniref:hypothetical protein n=1 Tax=Vibrio kanaloae TaxID=170673 RepID=UPI001EFC65C0|nr:hypothetical protein [Vibrio kanaloae]MCG9559869.1 hypothetical protein [Vibrio kanaloae]